jgi:uncharacterized protein involved in exopolysaccharide biosynthesis
MEQPHFTELTNRAVESDEIDFGTVIRIIRSGRWTVICVTLLCSLAGLAYAVFGQTWYRSEVLLVQVNTDNASSSLAQLGGLASLAGINIGSVGSDSQTSLAVLRSRDLIRNFLLEKDLLPTLFPERWNEEKRDWKDQAEAPDIRDAVTMFDEKIRTVSDNKKTGVIKMTIEWTEPQVSAAWANQLVSMVNVRLRERTIAEAQRNINYLQSALKETTVPPLQSSIAKLLESEMQKLMIARGSEEFAFKVIDGAVPPKKPFRPRRVVIVAGSVLMGMFLSVLILLVRQGVRRSLV